MSERDQATAENLTSESAVIESDSLVEEVSIDGMCGVY
jgi:mycofactocin precursor